jgi:hypothetical protein
MISQTEKDAWKLIEKCKFVYDQLPGFLRLPLKHPDSREVFDFVDRTARIEALATTAKAGKGTDATLIVRDELAEHEYGEINYRSIMPSIDAGGKSIDLSTITKRDIENHFTTRVLKAYEGAEMAQPLPEYGKWFERYTGAGATLLFLGWRLRPVRQEGMTLEEFWEKEVVPNYDPIGREENYPETIEEALSSPKAKCRFDVDKLDILKTYLRKPLRTMFSGRVRIYKEPQIGIKYVMAHDPSKGLEDPCAGIVADWRTCEKVADVTGKISPEEQSSILYELYEMYNQPFTGVEVKDAAGDAIVKDLESMGVRNLYYYKKDTAGWWTGSRTRPVMIEDLAGAVRELAFIEPSADALSQFYNFVITDKPDGDARKGCHDDFVIAWAIWWQIRREMRTGDFKIISLAPKVGI